MSVTVGTAGYSRQKLEKLEEVYEGHKVLERTQQLAERIPSTHNKTLPKVLFNEFDKLDEERGGYMLAAEKAAGRPPPNGIYEWLSVLEQTEQTIAY